MGKVVQNFQPRRTTYGAGLQTPQGNNQWIGNSFDGQMLAQQILYANKVNQLLASIQAYDSVTGGDITIQVQLALMQLAPSYPMSGTVANGYFPGVSLTNWDNVGPDQLALYNAMIATANANGWR